MPAVRPPALWLSIAATAISAVAVAAMASTDGPRRPLTFAGAILLPDGYYNAPSEPASSPALPSRPSAAASTARMPAAPSAGASSSQHRPPSAWVAPVGNGAPAQPTPRPPAATAAPSSRPASTPPAPKPTSRVDTPRTGVPVTPGSESSPAALAQALFRALNDERKKAGLPLLGWSDELQRSAAAHNQAMAAANQLGSRVGGELALGARQANQGVAGSYAAESVGYAEGTAPSGAFAVHRQMLAERAPDDRRRQNMLSTAVTAVGIDVLFDAVHGRLWVTEDFAQFS